jgi:hypothetical protein
MPGAYPRQRGIGKWATKEKARTASLAVVMTGLCPVASEILPVRHEVAQNKRMEDRPEEWAVRLGSHGNIAAGRQAVVKPRGSSSSKGWMSKIAGCKGWGRDASRRRDRWSRLYNRMRSGTGSDLWVSRRTKISYGPNDSSILLG